MIQFLSEYTTSMQQLPKLSQSSLYVKFDQQSGLTNTVREAIMDRESIVSPASMQEIMALIRLNGSPIAKKAVKAFEEGKLILIFNKDRSKVPAVLPFIIIQNKKKETTAYVFADRVVSNITSSHEYPNLMATMEAAYLAAAMQSKPTNFMLNRALMLNLCDLYTKMCIMPLEQKLYMKGENLTKAMLYTIAYFYRMIDGDKMDAENVPFQRLVTDKISPETKRQIVAEVKMMETPAIGGLIGLIKQINPVRYKDLDAVYMTHFISSCGMPLVFALENIPYLFMLITSAAYKTKVTQYGLNKFVSDSVHKCVKTLNAMDIVY